MQPKCNPDMADAAVLVLVGTLGGAAVGGFSSWKIAMISTKSAERLAEGQRAHDATEADATRRHDRALEEQQALRTACLTVRARIACIADRLRESGVVLRAADIPSSVRSEVLSCV